MNSTDWTRTEVVCRGSIALGTGCGRCRRCQEEQRRIVKNACDDCNLCIVDGYQHERHPIQPIGADFSLADGIHIKQMTLPVEGMLVPQHAHRYDHTTMLAAGSVRIWVDDVDMGARKAPCPIWIAAGVKHTFLSLEDNTVLYCIHRVDRTGKIDVEEEHHLVKEN